MLIAVLFFLIIFLVYYLDRRLLNYWQRYGFKQLETKFFFGNAGEVFRLKKPMPNLLAEIYQKHKHLRCLGIYFSYKPVLLINDPVLVQKILISDFSKFHDRPMPVDEKKEPLSGHLFSLPGQKWRELRVKLTPTFTSGKLKGMFPVIKDCAQVLEDFLVKNVESGIDVFEFRDLTARYTTNIISSVAFGIDNDCINEPDHIFRRMGAKFFETNRKNGIKNLLAFLGGPNLFYKLQLKFVDQDVEDFIFSVVNQTIDYREKNNYARNDFMQMMIQLKNRGFVSADNDENKTESDKEPTRLTLEEVAAQAFVFFVAGFETSSSTILFCLFELARHPKIVKKIQDEIDKVLSAAGPDGFTYENLAEMKYLECCIDETLRKYPVLPFLFRSVTRDYKIPDTDLVIPKDNSVFISVLGLHRDPEIYENPMEFRPERFLDSPNGTKFNKGSFYLPFGDGPRNCIGMRMGKLTTKIGVAKVLTKFKLELEDKEMINKELDFNPTQFILMPLENLGIKLVPRK